MTSSVSTPTTSYLVVSSGSSSCDIYRLKSRRRVTIGRASQNRIVISDRKCSRHHAEVVWLHGDWYIGDCGSQNGTSVNGRHISGYHRLEPGDCVRIASYELRFAYDLTQDNGSDSQHASDSAASSVHDDMPVLNRPDRIVHNESTYLDIRNDTGKSPSATGLPDIVAGDGASADGSIA